MPELCESLEGGMEITWPRKSPRVLALWEGIILRRA